MGRLTLAYRIEAKAWSGLGMHGDDFLIGGLASVPSGYSDRNGVVSNRIKGDRIQRRAI